MSGLWKMVVSIYSLLIIAVSCVFVGLAAGSPEPLRWMKVAAATPANRLITGVLAGLIAVASLVVLIRSLGKPRARAMLVQKAPDGQVVITVPAIKQMIARAVRQVDGVREVRTGVSYGRNGVVAQLEIMVNPESKVPELSSLVQSRVREHLEELAGLRVERIEVTVDDFATRPVVH